MIAQETVRIEPASYIYRVCHRIMEGDCQMDHGPKMVTVGPLEADVYCVTNAMYAQFLRESVLRKAAPDGAGVAVSCRRPRQARVAVGQ